MKKTTDFAYYLARFFREYLPGTRNLGKNTIMAYRDTFRILLLFCRDIHGVIPEKLTVKRMDGKLVVQYLDWLQSGRGCSISTRNQRLAAIHSFFRYLQSQEPIYMFTCQKILEIPFKKAPHPLVRHLTSEQTKSLLAVKHKETKAGRRNMVLLSVLYDTGARVQEVCDLRARDVRLEYPPLVTLTGKGNKSRHVPLLGNTAELLRIYMDENELLTNGKQDMPLFQNQRRQTLTRGGVSHILQKYAEKALLEYPNMPKKVTPHMLRHSKAVHLLQAGVPMPLIRDILGHESIQTTELYARLDMETKRKVLESAYVDITPGEMADWNQDRDLLDFLENL